MTLSCGFWSVCVHYPTLISNVALSVMCVSVCETLRGAMTLRTCIILFPTGLRS